MTGALERFEPTGVQLVDEAVLYWGRANLCPTSYRIGQKDDGAPNWPDLLVAGASLHALDVPPIRNLPDTYVVHGRFGMMAALQTALAQREGVDVRQVAVSDAEATVRVILPGEAPDAEGQLFTVTYKQAERAGWVKRNPCYASMPQKMLPARATTAGINARAPGVLRGIALRIAHVAPLDLDDLPSPLSVGAGSPTPPVVPAPAEYMAHVAPDALRLEVVERLERLRQLDPAAHAELRAEWKSLRGPVVQITRANPDAHVALLPDLLVLRYMLEEIEGALEVAPSGVAVPESVHDDAPESRGYDPDESADTDPDAPERSYGDADPGRPF